MSLPTECAVRIIDVKEVRPRSAGSGSPRVVGEARIDGSKYRLSRAGFHHEVRDNCCRVTGSLFLPADP